MKRCKERNCASHQDIIRHDFFNFNLKSLFFLSRFYQEKIEIQTQSTPREEKSEKNSRNNFNSTIASSTSTRCVYIYKFISCRAMIMLWKRRVGCSIANNYSECTLLLFLSPLFFHSKSQFIL